MKELLFVITGFLLSNYCIGQNFLNKTVWLNVTPVEKNDISGNILNAMIFTEKDSVYIYSTANVDDVVLYPTNTGYGTFLYKKKKYAQLTVTTNYRDTTNYNAKLKKKDELILTSDSTYAIYRKVNLDNNPKKQK